MFESAHLFILTMIEPGLYFIAACLLRLRPLLQKLLKASWLAAISRNRATSREDLQIIHLRPGDMVNIRPRYGGEFRDPGVIYGGEVWLGATQMYRAGVCTNSTYVGSERSARYKEEDKIMVEHTVSVTTNENSLS